MAVKSDDVVIDEQTEKTTLVNKALAACNTAYKTIAHFVRKVYADNKPVQNQFG